MPGVVRAGADEQADAGDAAVCDAVAGLLAAGEGVRCEGSGVRCWRSLGGPFTFHVSRFTFAVGKTSVLRAERGFVRRDVRGAKEGRRRAVFVHFFADGTDRERTGVVRTLSHQNILAGGP